MVNLPLGLSPVEIRPKTHNCRWPGDLTIQLLGTVCGTTVRECSPTRSRGEGRLLLRDAVRNLRLLAVFAVAGNERMAPGGHWRESLLDFFEGGGKTG